MILTLIGDQNSGPEGMKASAKPDISVELEIYPDSDKRSLVSGDRWEAILESGNAHFFVLIEPQRHPVFKGTRFDADVYLLDSENALRALKPGKEFKVRGVGEVGKGIVTSVKSTPVP